MPPGCGGKLVHMQNTQEAERLINIAHRAPADSTAKPAYSEMSGRGFAT